MKAEEVCYSCLKKMTSQAAEMASSDKALQAESLRKGLQVLDRHFSTQELTLTIAKKIHQAVKDASGNPDPYAELKRNEIAMARQLLAACMPDDPTCFFDLLKLSARGNTLDFFKPMNTIIAQMEGELVFAIDHSVQFEARLADADRILFLADNAGEVFFDLPILKWLREKAEVIYVVKPQPVQNDLTLADINAMGLEEELGDVITTGMTAPGVVYPKASEAFRAAYKRADLIFAKGMGFYEGLSELPPENKIFYCLMAKCEPVARSLGVPLGSYVALFR